MKILLIEDEISASSRLQKLINEINPQIEILAVLDTVEDSIAWLSNNPEPDLIFLDIQLSDGLSFEIFQDVDYLQTPVIFTTAYNEYAIQAFQLNSIDYLLKPIDRKDLEKALIKYNKRIQKGALPNFDVLLSQLKIKKQEYRSRFLVKTGSLMQTILDDIAYIIIENQMVHPILFSKRQHSLDYNLDELELLLNPKRFFRINRQMIVNIKAIKSIQPYFNARLLITLDPPSTKECVVSREKTNLFKQWIEQ